MTEQELREMKLHERRVIEDPMGTSIVSICRVIGGWVYAGVFVPEFRPSHWYPVVVSQDGSQWCCLMGPNLQEGLSGWGSTPEEACKDFDGRWYKK